MASISLVCSWCGDNFKLRVAEFNRRSKLGKKRFFCCRSCAIYHQHEASGNNRVPVTKTCQYCKSKFKTMSGAKSASHCSRDCASAGSVTPKRLAAARAVGKKKNFSSMSAIHSIAKGLRTREWWKYIDLDAYLKRKKIAHVFEFSIPQTRRIFDLALVDLKVLVEFDGGEHSCARQRKIDHQKDSLAKRRGWRVVRIPDHGKVLPPRSIKNLI